MAISPIGNITYINQNSQANSTQQANALGRADMTNILNKEFEDKIKDIQEVRPTETSDAIHPDSKGNGGLEQEQKKQKQLSEKQEDTKEEFIKSSHILDIKV
ncbi:hypothetical protein [Helicobacter sp. 11S03491-1]|uniref:hypothetical protein n=1 Tax=Helicobacter sp. 11S03491-1 TaxID=1476196 RepID=UPI000BA7A3A9|nr:hypothetical protein [Helicobacter sp. 11S03491-1]PAF42007.1 hypothetical protein BKH45_05350 [Helicobacter sp. 11S03491-1]